MKKIIVISILFLLVGGGSCAPTAEFVKYDIYNHHPFVYNEDGINELPPDILEEGESWVWRIGTVKRIYRPKRRFDYKSVVVVTGNRGYEYTYDIVGKLDVRNGTRCYHMRENENGEIKHYLIIGTKRYLI